MADFLSDIFGRAVAVGEDFARKTLGLGSTAAPESTQRQAEVKGQDTVSRQASQEMPRWLWLVLAGLIALVVVVAWKR